MLRSFVPFISLYNPDLDPLKTIFGVDLFFDLKLRLTLINQPNSNLAISCIESALLQMFIDSLYERSRIKWCKIFLESCLSAVSL